MKFGDTISSDNIIFRSEVLFLFFPISNKFIFSVDTFSFFCKVISSLVDTKKFSSVFFIFFPGSQ